MRYKHITQEKLRALEEKAHSSLKKGHEEGLTEAEMFRSLKPTLRLLLSKEFSARAIAAYFAENDVKIGYHIVLRWVKALREEVEKKKTRKNAKAAAMMSANASETGGEHGNIEGKTTDTAARLGAGEGHSTDSDRLSADEKPSPREATGTETEEAGKRQDMDPSPSATKPRRPVVIPTTLRQFKVEPDTQGGTFGHREKGPNKSEE